MIYSFDEKQKKLIWLAVEKLRCDINNSNIHSNIQ